MVGQEGVCQKSGWVQLDVTCIKEGRGVPLSKGFVMRRKRKRSTVRQRPAKRRRRGQVGGVSPALIVGIGKAGYGITKAIGEHQQKRAKKISDKRWRDYLSGKRKSYGGESFNCSLM